MSAHPSSSAIQTAAEAAITTAVEGRLGVPLVLKPGKVTLSGNVSIELDAAAPDMSVVVEIYARQGRLKGAQPKKIAQDILKLALLKREPAYQDTQTIIAFASFEAHASITGWLRQAATAFGVTLMVVEIPAELSEQIQQAQAVQMMVNAEN